MRNKTETKRVKNEKSKGLAYFYKGENTFHVGHYKLRSCSNEASFAEGQCVWLKMKKLCAYKLWKPCTTIKMQNIDLFLHYRRVLQVYMAVFHCGGRVYFYF